MNNLTAKACVVTILISFSGFITASAQLNNKNLRHKETLTRLLTAQLALQRNLPELALENYMIVAKYTQDPEVAQLATELALQLQQIKNALSAAEIWANAAKNDVQAQLIAVTLFIGSDQNKALVFLNNAFKCKDQNIDQSLMNIFDKLTENGQKTLANAVFKVSEQQSDNPLAQLAAAQLAAMQLDIKIASAKTDQALKLRPDLTSAIELKAKLIRHQHDDDKPALTYLQQTLNKYPRNATLRMFYISALIDNEMTKQAITELQKLQQDTNFAGVAYIKLGEIYVLQKNYALAESNLQKALKFENSADLANYYLGQLAEHKGNNTQAISFYKNITEYSEYHSSAYLRIAQLYSLNGEYENALHAIQNSNPTTFFEQKQILLSEIEILIASRNLEQALENCNTTIAILPDDIDFLYSRSIIYGLMRQAQAAEQDLKKILGIEPNNANALNALGFTLANQPSRMTEAMTLLQKAISINPDNPAYIDSMGWLLYKMGKNQESLDLLGKAYKLSTDSEIAAHFGEVLWVSGNKDAAKDIWKKAMSASPLHKQVISDTLDKLKIPISDLQNLSDKPRDRIRLKN